jgi:polyhydroxybutyrate depolymerase
MLGDRSAGWRTPDTRAPRVHTRRVPGPRTRVRKIAMAAAACALVTACHSAAGSSSEVATSTLAVPVSAAASGCGHVASVGSVTASLSIGGHSRLVIVHVPTGYSASSPTPLVLNMHGSAATAADQEAFSGMDVTSDADGFIVAYPQGLIPDGTGFDWNVPGVPLVGGRAVPSGSADDVAFLTQLVGALEARYCIDPSTVYATGFSGGARMASQLACDASTTFAAVAPVSGLRRPTPCSTTRAVPVVAFHGTADPVDPYDGNGQAYWTYSVPQAAEDWADQDRCSTTPTTTDGSGYTLTAYQGCADGATVELYSVGGEGHEWPGGPAMPKSLTSLLGPQSNAVDADDLMWAFFSAHPLS